MRGLERGERSGAVVLRYCILQVGPIFVELQPAEALKPLQVEPAVPEHADAVEYEAGLDVDLVRARKRWFLFVSDKVV